MQAGILEKFHGVPTPENEEETAGSDVLSRNLLPRIIKHREADAPALDENEFTDRASGDLTIGMAMSLDFVPGRTLHKADLERITRVGAKLDAIHLRSLTDNGERCAVGGNRMYVRHGRIIGELRSFIEDPPHALFPRVSMDDLCASFGVADGVIHCLLQSPC